MENSKHKRLSKNSYRKEVVIRMLFSVVIPTIPKHDKFLKNVLNSLSSESNFILEVIIARSELANHKIPNYEKFLKRLGIEHDLQEKIRLSSVPVKNLAFANMNRGWNLAKGKYVSFLGADDIYSPYRLRIINEVIRQKPKANLILHSHYLEDFAPTKKTIKIKYFSQNIDQIGIEELLKKKLVETKEIYSATFPTGKRNHVGESIHGPMLAVPNNKFGITEITQGHSTVRTELRSTIAFRPQIYGEDGFLCADILENFGEVFFLAERLSIYRKYNSSNRYVKGHLRLKYEIFKRIPPVVIRMINK